MRSSDDQELGTVARVLATDREDLFDGIVIQTSDGLRFVDAPEVARIAERRVTLSITAAEAEQLPEPEPARPSSRRTRRRVAWRASSAAAGAAR